MFSFIGLFISVPIINDHTANNVRETLLNCPLPEKTSLCDSVSAAGKLDGNGNGMQYFGAILIQSQLDKKSLETYYTTYRDSKWSYIVDIQSSERLAMIEHRNISFSFLSNVTDFSNYYVVYSWGTSNFIFSDFDIRGH